MSKAGEDSQGRWFTAVDADSGTLLATIEAASVEEAASRFVAVAPLVGIAPARLGEGLLWIAVAEPIDGLPTFRDCYFLALERIAPLTLVTPGSTTLQ